MTLRIVDDRMHHGNLLLVAREAQEVHGPRVEEAAAADAGQIELRQRFGRQAQERCIGVAILRQPVVGEEVEIAQDDAIPAPDPFVVDRELALGVDAAAELAVAGLADERIGVELVDAVGADLVGAILQSLPELALQQHALPAGDARGEGRIHVGCDRPVIGDVDGIAVDRRLGEAPASGSRTCA